MKVYLDNASTTAIDPEVYSAMEPYFKTHFGNPSSIHSHGREVRSAIERSRKKVAELLNASPSEIFFTSCGTEADNSVINGIVNSLGVKNIITSPIEHHAVLHSIEHLEKLGKAKGHFIELDEKGHVNYDHLQSLLEKYPNSLVTLMHINNEVGNINNLELIGNFCKETGSYFHSDAVQAIGHYPINLHNTNLNALAGSAHKFHGPKGIGLMYLDSSIKIEPYLFGGGQERNMRAGTENVYGIVGLSKALEISCRDMEKNKKHITALKERMIEKLTSSIEGVEFNGNSADLAKSSYKVLNVSFPESQENEMLLFNLDINNISASGGSACTSGSDVGSHVLKALGINPNRGAVRFSFSKFNTSEEIDYVVEKLAEMFSVPSN